MKGANRGSPEQIDEGWRKVIVAAPQGEPNSPCEIPGACRSMNRKCDVCAPQPQGEPGRVPLDPDGDVSRAAYREAEAKGQIDPRNSTRWQVWREAVRWCAPPAQVPQPVALTAAADELDRLRAQVAGCWQSVTPKSPN